MNKYEDIKAIGEHVVLRVEKVVEEKKEKVTDSGFILPAEETIFGSKINKPNYNGKERTRLFVLSIGDNVDKEKYKIEVGDEVICNDLDVQSFGDDENDYAVTRAQSIRCVVKVS